MEEDTTMPLMDKTGPLGEGPKTGRGLGDCDDVYAAVPLPEFAGDDGMLDPIDMPDHPELVDPDEPEAADTEFASVLDYDPEGQGAQGTCGGTRRRDGSGGGVGNIGTDRQPEDGAFTSVLDAAYDAGWDESKHPRKGGKFAPKGQGDSGSNPTSSGETGEGDNGPKESKNITTAESYEYPLGGQYNETIANLPDGRKATINTQYGVVSPHGKHAADCDQVNKIGGRCNCGLLDGIDVDALVSDARKNGKKGRPPEARRAPEQSGKEWLSPRGLTLTEEMDREDSDYSASVPLPPEPQFDAESEAARVKAARASEEFHKAQQAYRSGTIGDDEYLAARKKHDEASAEYDRTMEAWHAKNDSGQFESVLDEAFANENRDSGGKFAPAGTPAIESRPDAAEVQRKAKEVSGRVEAERLHGK